MGDFSKILHQAKIRFDGYENYGDTLSLAMVCYLVETSSFAVIAHSLNTEDSRQKRAIPLCVLSCCRNATRSLAVAHQW